MPLDIKIQDDQISDLSDDARRILKKQVDSYVVDLLKEARLVEEDMRERDAKKEITSSNIMQAARRGKNNFNKRKPWYVKHSRWISPISSIFVGLLFNPDSWSNEQWKIYLFVFVFGIAIATTILLFSKEDE
jgi:hypothetical protein